MSISCCSKLSVMNLCIWNIATVVALIIQTVNNNDWHGRSALNKKATKSRTWFVRYKDDTALNIDLSSEDVPSLIHSSPFTANKEITSGKALEGVQL